MEKLSNRIPSLDGLRTISIILVIIGHWLHVMGGGNAGNFGNLGVRVFFVISGFLITGLLLKEMEKTSDVNLLKFYFRRTLRIFPPFYFYLFVIFTTASLGFIYVSLKSLLFASVYVSDYANPSDWFLGHTWSLAVEEQFYLLFPTILLVLGVRKTKIFLFLLVSLNPLIRLADFQIFGSDPIWVTKGFHANMDALAVGCLLALFYERLHRNHLYQKFIRSRLINVLPFVILLANLQSEHPRLFFGAILTVINVLIALCIDGAVTNYDSFIGKILNSAPAVMLGMMSYSIYLWQQPFFNPQNSSFLTRPPFNFVGLILMTLISYYGVEKYSLKMRQRLEAKFFTKNAAPPPKSRILVEEI